MAIESLSDISRAGASAFAAGGGAGSALIIPIACGDEATPIAVASGLITFRTPAAMTVTGLSASLNVAQASGSALTVDVKVNGASVLSTLLTFNNGETTTTTASTAHAPSTFSLSANDIIRIDVTQVGDGTAAGLKVYLVAPMGGLGGALTAIPIACGDETTPITAGTGKVSFRMPYGMSLSAVRASLVTAQTTGSLLTVDVKQYGTSILSTLLTFDNTETTTTTAATPPVISTLTLADDAEIKIDVTQVGDSGAAGLKVYLIGVTA